jgi:hypothetical protein
MGTLLSIKQDNQTFARSETAERRKEVLQRVEQRTRMNAQKIRAHERGVLQDKQQAERVNI